MNKYWAVVKNFSYLSAVQFINLLVTLATYPFLIRVLGKEVFGLVVFAQALVNYLTILVSFGFQISATREVSIHRGNPDKLNEIFSSVLILKGLLFLISFGLLILIISFIPQAREEKLLYLLSMAACFFEFIFPSWLFQGIEKMGYSTLITVIAKSIFFVLIFIFIRDESDYLLVPLFTGIGSVLAGIISLWFALVKEKIRFSFQPVSYLAYYLKESVSLFIINLANQLYAGANKVIIGLVMGMGDVAIYDLAEKMVLAAKLPQTMVNQAVFPRVSKDKDPVFTKNILLFSIVGEIGVYFFMFLMAPILVLVFGGGEMVGSTDILRFLAITVPINGISSYLGIQYLVAHGYQKLYTKVIVYSVLLYAVVCCLLLVAGWVTVNNVIWATIATELFALIAMVVVVRLRLTNSSAKASRIRKNV